MQTVARFVVVVALLVVGCGATSVPAACAPVQRLPTPLSNSDRVTLERLYESAQKELTTKKWALTMIDGDEARGTLSFGSEQPTEEMCRDLRERYGPLVEVIYYPAGELF